MVIWQNEFPNMSKPSTLMVQTMGFSHGFSMISPWVFPIIFRYQNAPKTPQPPAKRAFEAAPNHRALARWAQDLPGKQDLGLAQKDALKSHGKHVKIPVVKCHNS